MGSAQDLYSYPTWIAHLRPALHTNCVSKTLFGQYDKLNGTRTEPVQVFGFNCPLETRITPAQDYIT